MYGERIFVLVIGTPAVRIRLLSEGFQKFKDSAAGISTKHGFKPFTAPLTSSISPMYLW